jgi:nitroreductase
MNFENKTIWFIKRIIISGLMLLDTAKLISKESFSAIKHKMAKNDDKDYLNSFIKMRSHFVEKMLFHPTRYSNKKNCDRIAFQLKEALKEWDKRNYKLTPPVVWAKKMLSEYKYVENKKGCPNEQMGLKRRNTFFVDSKNLINLMKSRRSIRHFTKETISSEEKKLLFESALWAPSSCNKQAVSFIMVDKPSLKKAISDTLRGGFRFFYEAPYILLFIADKRNYNYPKERFTPYQDGAAAMQNVLLMAESLNLGACWGTYTSYSSVINERKMKKLLKIPDYFMFTGALAIGHTDQVVCYVARDKIEEKFSHNYFNNKNGLEK